MPTIFNSKDSVFFVGGRGTKAGDADAGGCTLDFWLASQTLSDVMDTNGEPLSAAAAWNGGQDACEVLESVGGKVLITKAAQGWFSEIEAGHIANVEFDGIYADGRYEVTGNDMTDDGFEIDLPFIIPLLCDVKVGGAFNTLQTAWPLLDATLGYDVIIYTNKSQSKTVGDFVATFDLSTFGGSQANKSSKFAMGFDTQPGDEGQITLDGEDDGAFNPNGGIRFDAAIYNIFFMNIIVKNAYIGWKTSSSSVKGVFLKNCEANSNSANGFRLNYGYGYVLISCKAESNGQQGFYLSYSGGGPHHLFINCIAEDNGADGFYNIGGLAGSTLIGCLAVGNGVGGFKTYSHSGHATLKDCVAYDNTGDGFKFGRFTPVAINCIAKDNGGWGFYADIGNNLMAPYVSHCCAHGNTSGQFSLKAAMPERDSIEEDPLFVDAANNDFRLKTNSPCLKTGLSTLGAL